MSETRTMLRREPGLAAILGANLVASFTSGLMVPVLPLFLFARGFGFVQVGLAFSLLAAAGLVVQLLVSRRPGFLARPGVIAPLLVLPVCAYPAYLWVDSVAGFVAVAGLVSLAGSAAAPGLSILLAEAAPADRRATIFSHLGTTTSLAYAAALVVGGLLLPLGYVAVFAAAAFLSLLGFMLLAGVMLGARLTRPRNADAARAYETLRDAMAGLRRARADLHDLLPTPPRDARNAHLAALHAFLFGVSLAVYPVYFPLFLREKGLPLAWVGAAVAASWVTFALCQPFGARHADRTGRHRRILVVSVAVAALLNLGMAFSPLWGVILAWTLLGIADGVGRPLTSALVADAVQGAGRGGAFGLLSAADTAARIAGPVGIGLIVAYHGMPLALTAVTLLMLVSIVPLVLIRRDPPPAPAPVAAPAGGAA